MSQKMLVIEKLPPREREVFDALCARAEATAAELEAAIPGGPSNSAIRIMLSRLEKKGFVTHRVVKKRYVYSVALPKQRVQKSALKHLARTFFQGSSVGTAAAFMELAENVKPTRQEAQSLGPFAVSKTHVATLSDQALRDLLGKLLEAEASTRGIPMAGIDLGGNQTAPDGGVDASIDWRGAPEPSGWLPRRKIYYQCKAQVVPPNRIGGEIRPKGKLRPIFYELAESKGAYILFSTDDIGTNGLRARLAKMRVELADLPESENVHLDFYGADRISRWVNQHPGVALWLLAENGRALGGWQPFGPWSSAESSETPYLVDETIRTSIDNSEANVRSAIGAMRGALATYGGCVRLVGISGMGKTRLAEAVFDARVGGGKVPSPSLAIYADAARELVTGAALIAEQLVVSSVEAILVVDNCAARTHSQLAGIVRRKGSRVSLLTIDYDVGDSQPEGTLLVRLTGNSEGVLLALLKQRHPDLSEGERLHLTRFAEGNARVALAIARSSRQGVDLATLTDDELIDRLFQFGRAQDAEAVRRTADAASLVYAFHTDPTDNVGVEHPVLAQIAGLPADVFYRHVQVMLDWGIAQQRGPQRAIKPDPIANRFARKVLHQSDPDALLDSFRAGPERLFASFARRLGQLHDLPAAVRVARRLLSEGEWLGDLATQNEIRQRAFSNLAPAAPEDALRAIERALAVAPAGEVISSSHRRCDLSELLVHLAYDEALFPRAMEALLEFVLADSHHSDTQTKDLFLQRFWPGLSWTLAKSGARLKVIDRLLDDDRDTVRALGVEALDHMLETYHLSSSFDPEFGSRLRNEEWRPLGQEYLDWIEAAYQRLEHIAVSSEPEAMRAQQIVAQHLREHLESGVGERAVQAMRRVRGKGYWDDGWRASNDALHFGCKGGTHAREIVCALEKELRPQNLEECFEAFVLGEPWRHWHPSGRENASTRDIGLLAKAVGARLARSKSDLAPFFARASVAEGQTSVVPFGEGMGCRVEDLDTLWRDAYQSYASTPEAIRNPGVLIGILRQADRRDETWVEARLDAATRDPLLSQFIVHLHAARKLGTRDVERFLVALDEGRISPERLGGLMYGGATSTIPAADLASLLDAMIARKDGATPALGVLFMRVFGDRQKKHDIAPELIAVARKLLTDRRSYEDDRSRADHELAGLARLVLGTEAGGKTAAGICRTLRNVTRQKKYWGGHELHELADLLMRMHPRVVLDEIVLTANNEPRRDLSVIFFGGWSADIDHHQGREKTHYDIDVILDWVAEDPQPRAQLLAGLVPYTAAGEGSEFQWSPIALGLIEVAADPIPVLRAFEDRFWTGISSGPFSGRYVRRRPLVAALMHHGDRRIRNWARRTAEEIEAMIKHYDAMDRESDSRFE